MVFCKVTIIIRNMKRKLLYTTLIIAILCVISILVCNRTIKKHTVSKLYTEVNTIPSNNVGLLLGTSPKLKNGNNNLYFDYRILATVELYKAGKIKYILISGDNRKEDYNEPEEMKKALIQKGIPRKIHLFRLCRIPDSRLCCTCQRSVWTESSDHHLTTFP